ncbi:type IV toxin-antitoxin system AbiEi family antitoxin domain-containing protein [Nocardioides humilatus]|uniref:Type IV toxin-antitoxin system AbiEi family antitoxin domain-containing protein n=1 Tax=Nocardioides humilatus TaxID=2607660 RepID=A0A5B1LLP2_9ACTN|nr:type IV toxin-antitoxin system AbiEi family antitoxin domain-containing protein [Nocardioides humilatus]KAA1421675.1 type IV toxin-antitoxin system AbiEi family antitoxin domain-containing protein [Nocardioides humilatus]
MDALGSLLSQQDGVIARRQMLSTGFTPAFVARKVRRREWVQVHPGVYVDHTGALTWQQRAWAAVLACWPAALDGRPERQRRGSDQPG